MYRHLHSHYDSISVILNAKILSAVKYLQGILKMAYVDSREKENNTILPCGPHISAPLSSLTHGSSYTNSCSGTATEYFFGKSFYWPN